jgi:FtsZ-binding cell division protein ZapB
VFGKPTRYGTGENIKRRIEQGQLVADEVDRLKAQGKSLNEEEFEAIGLRTAVGAKSKVKSLLREQRFWAHRVHTLIQLGHEMFKNYRR